MSADLVLPGMKKTEEEHRREICVVGRWLFERGFVPATDGNISVRLDSHRILVSPTGARKGEMDPDDMVITDSEGLKISGRLGISSEIGMHLQIYAMRPDVQAICHAHPAISTGFAASGVALDRALLCEQVVNLGAVPLASYGTPGTPELAASIRPFVSSHDAILLANHGVVTYGPDLLSAFYRMEMTEHLARVSMVTRIIGHENLLSDTDVDVLFAARARYGVHTGAGEAARPITCDSEHSEWVTMSRRRLETLIDERVKAATKPTRVGMLISGTTRRLRKIRFVDTLATLINNRSNDWLSAWQARR